MIYWYGLNSMMNESMGLEEVYTAFGIDPDAISLSEEYMNSLKIPSESQPLYDNRFFWDNQIKEIYKEIAKIPKLSDVIKLKYIYQITREEIHTEEFQFDPRFFSKKMEWALDYWLGRRKPISVGERNQWKCNFCNYKEKCPSFG